VLTVLETSISRLSVNARIFNIECPHPSLFSNLQSIGSTMKLNSNAEKESTCLILLIGIEVPSEHISTGMAIHLVYHIQVHLLLSQILQYRGVGHDVKNLYCIPISTMTTTHISFLLAWFIIQNGASTVIFVTEVIPPPLILLSKIPDKVHRSLEPILKFPAAPEWCFLTRFECKAGAIQQPSSQISTSNENQVLL